MLRPANAGDVAAIEAIIEVAYSPYIARIGRKPGLCRVYMSKRL